MTEPADQELIDLLVAREGSWTDVELFDGKALRVLNIAWGYDQGDEYAHVTTNCSPSPGRRVPMDFFFTNDVTRVIDPQTREVLYEGSDASSDDIDLLENPSGAVSAEPVTHVEVLLEVIPQWEVQERPAALQCFITSVQWSR